MTNRPNTRLAPLWFARSGLWLFPLLGCPMRSGDDSDGAIASAVPLCADTASAEGTACQPMVSRSCPAPEDSCVAGAPCCAVVPSAGGAFDRGWDRSDLPEQGGELVVGFQAAGAAPATLRRFALDEREVSVRRFFDFLQDMDRWLANNPLEGAGALLEVRGSGWPVITQPDVAPAQETAQAIAAGCPDLAALQEGFSAVAQDTGASGETEPVAPLPTVLAPLADGPMACVTWGEAQLFCIWDGGRLPTEAEWNFVAAAGSEQRPFPWGTDAVRGAADSALQRSLAFGVREWVFDGCGDGPCDLSTYAQSPCEHCAVSTGTHRVVRGGSEHSSAAQWRTGYRDGLLAVTRSPEVGFRCARDDAY